MFVSHAGVGADGHRSSARTSPRRPGAPSCFREGDYRYEEASMRLPKIRPCK